MGWTPRNALLSLGDDLVALQWPRDGGEAAEKLAALDACVTALHVQPAELGAKAAPLVLATAGSDGRFRMLNGTGRVERVVEAHQVGACCAAPPARYGVLRVSRRAQ